MESTVNATNYTVIIKYIQPQISGRFTYAELNVSCVSSNPFSIELLPSPTHASFFRFLILQRSSGEISIDEQRFDDIESTCLNAKISMFDCTDLKMNLAIYGVDTNLIKVSAIVQITLGRRLYEPKLFLLVHVHNATDARNLQHLSSRVRQHYELERYRSQLGFIYYALQKSNSF